MFNWFKKTPAKRRPMARKTRNNPKRKRAHGSMIYLRHNPWKSFEEASLRRPSKYAGWEFDLTRGPRAGHFSTVGVGTGKDAVQHYAGHDGGTYAIQYEGGKTKIVPKHWIATTAWRIGHLGSAKKAKKRTKRAAEQAIVLAPPAAPKKKKTKRTKRAAEQAIVLAPPPVMAAPSQSDVALAKYEAGLANEIAAGRGDSPRAKQFARLIKQIRSNPWFPGGGKYQGDAWHAGGGKWKGKRPKARTNPFWPWGKAAPTKKAKRSKKRASARTNPFWHFGKAVAPKRKKARHNPLRGAAKTAFLRRMEAGKRRKARGY